MARELQQHEAFVRYERDCSKPNDLSPPRFRLLKVYLLQITKGERYTDVHYCEISNVSNHARLIRSMPRRNFGLRAAPSLQVTTASGTAWKGGYRDFIGDLPTLYSTRTVRQAPKPSNLVIAIEKRSLMTLYNRFRCVYLQHNSCAEVGKPTPDGPPYRRSVK